jgi:UDP-N-acetylmuramoyl-tripeptide--D-alanyl-D-alanine ligase
VINETLTRDHQILIAEMGAYKRGEVKEICELVHPRIGIITSIGPEHYERFLTMANIEETNYELIASLPPEGLAVFNCENEHCRKLADRTRHTRVVRYSLANDDGRSDVWAEDIELSREGLRFTVAAAAGERTPVETALVGRLNVLNILGAISIARELGLTAGEIARGVGKLKPAPHRLEVKPGGGGTTIIDDSYNSNPFGAAEALHVLSAYTGGKRILITPGMIELGELHESENEKLGYQAAQACDFVILVGPEQTKPLAAGLRRAGFPEENLRIVTDLSEATAIFGKILRPGDVLLFENDLPDLYNE